jgi:hypothetical protein
VDSDDWRNPFAPSWVRVSPLRPFWEQHVRHYDPPWVKKSFFLDQPKKEVKMEVRIDLDENDLKQAVIIYLKTKDKQLVPQNIYFHVEKEEGYADRVLCTVRMQLGE